MYTTSNTAFCPYVCVASYLKLQRFCLFFISRKSQVLSLKCIKIRILHTARGQVYLGP